jgi:hypothetical protein
VTRVSFDIEEVIGTCPSGIFKQVVDSFKKSLKYMKQVDYSRGHMWRFNSTGKLLHNKTLLKSRHFIGISVLSSDNKRRRAIICCGINMSRRGLYPSSLLFFSSSSFYLLIY